MKLVVAGYYGCGNLGDDALLMGLLKGLSGRHEVTALSGEGLSALELPRVGVGERRDGLWKTTCFEAFFAHSDTSEYWEWNGSANGDWNLYHFDDYRKGMRAVPLVGEAPRFRELARDAGRWVGEWEIPRALLPISGPIGLTAVTEATHAGQSSLVYWALAHSSSQADFHQRASFVYSFAKKG